MKSDDFQPVQLTLLVMARRLATALTVAVLVCNLAVQGYTSQQQDVVVYTGLRFTCATKYQTTKCWGYGYQGRLGNGDTATRGDKPREMGGFVPILNLGTNRTVVQLSAGDEHACAILDNAAVKCWGRNMYGQLGLGDTQSRGSVPGDMGDNLPTVDLGGNRTARQVAVGYGYSCVLMDTEQVKCWGLNDVGQLNTTDLADYVGDEVGEVASQPTVEILGSQTVVQIAAGAYHACAMVSNGSVYCWGYDSDSRLGASWPISLGTNRTALQVSAGYDHTCVLLDNHQVKCWGLNSNGQLGVPAVASIGSNSSQMGDALPPVNLGTRRTAVQVAANNQRTCAILDDRSLKCWGAANVGGLGLESTSDRGLYTYDMGNYLPTLKLGTGRTVLQVSDGSTYHSCVVLDDLSIKCWGEGADGELGYEDTIAYGAFPGQMGDALLPVDLGIPAPSPPPPLPPSPAADLGLSVHAGMYVTCVTKSHVTKCWGRNDEGQLGLGLTGDRGGAVGDMGNSAPAVNLGTGRYAVQLSRAKGPFMCALLDNGRLKCWGSNADDAYALGLESSVPNLGLSPSDMGDALPAVNLGSNMSVVQMASCVRHACATLSTQSVKCWGYTGPDGSYLGTPSTSTADSYIGGNLNDMGDNLQTVEMLAGRNVTQVECGEYHSCALTTDGEVFCWGNADDGKLGLSTADHPVDLGTNRTVLQISVGWVHTCAVMDDRTLKCWGNSGSGQLGYGDLASRGANGYELGDSLMAVQIGSGRSVLQVSAGAFHTCVLLDNHRIKCWGLSNEGQLGLGSPELWGDAYYEMGNTLPYVDLGPGRTALQVSAGYDHTCAVLDDLSVKCWGGSKYGQLGLEDTNSMGYGPGQMGSALPTVEFGVPTPSTTSSPPSPSLTTPGSPPVATPPSPAPSGGAPGGASGKRYSAGELGGAIAGSLIGGFLLALIVMAVIMCCTASKRRVTHITTYFKPPTPVPTRMSA